MRTTGACLCNGLYATDGWRGRVGAVCVSAKPSCVFVARLFATRDAEAGLDLAATTGRGPSFGPTRFKLLFE